MEHPFLEKAGFILPEWERKCNRSLFSLDFFGERHKIKMRNHSIAAEKSCAKDRFAAQWKMENEKLKIMVFSSKMMEIRKK